MANVGPIPRQPRTMEARDVIDVLLGLVAQEAPTPPTDELMKEAHNLLQVPALVGSALTRASLVVDQLQQVLSGAGPPYTYFGHHPDSGLLGWWVDWPSVMDLPTREQREGSDYRVSEWGHTRIFGPDGTLRADFMGEV